MQRKPPSPPVRGRGLLRPLSESFSSKTGQRRRDGLPGTISTFLLQTPPQFFPVNPVTPSRSALGRNFVASTSPSPALDVRGGTWFSRSFWAPFGAASIFFAQRFCLSRANFSTPFLLPFFPFRFYFFATFSRYPGTGLEADYSVPGRLSPLSSLSSGAVPCVLSSLSCKPAHARRGFSIFSYTSYCLGLEALLSPTSASFLFPPRLRFRYSLKRRRRFPCLRFQGSQRRVVFSRCRPLSGAYFMILQTFSQTILREEPRPLYRTGVMFSSYHPALDASRRETFFLAPLRP